MEHPATESAKVERMTAEEWKRTHRDFKTIRNGQRYVLRWTDHGTGLVPVILVKEQNK